MTSERSGSTGSSRIGCRNVPCSFRLLVSQEDGDEQFVTIFDSYRCGNLNVAPHPEEVSLQAVLQLVHGALPLKLDKRCTKVHWQEGDSLLQIIVTQLLKYSGVVFGVAVVITLVAEGSHSSSIPIDAISSPMPSHSQLGNSLQHFSTSMTDTLSAMDDPTVFSTASDKNLKATEPKFSIDSQYPDQTAFNHSGRPRTAAAITEIIQSFFPVVEGILSDATDNVLSILGNSRALRHPSTSSSSLRFLRHLELQDNSSMRAVEASLRLQLTAFLFPIYLYKKPTPSLPLSEHTSQTSPSSVDPIISPRKVRHAIQQAVHFRRPADFESLCSVISTALVCHQGWLEQFAPDPSQLRYCRFLFHGNDVQLIKSLIAVVSFFIPMRELTQRMSDLPTQFASGSTVRSNPGSPLKGQKASSNEVTAVPFIDTAKDQFVKIPSSTYCYAAITTSVASPFALLGVLQEEVTNDNIAMFNRMYMPEWMPESKAQSCVVVDVQKGRCTVWENGQRNSIGTSPMVRHQLKAAVDCYKGGLPAPEAEESLLLGLQEIVATARCFHDIVSSSPDSVSSTSIRESIDNIAAADMNLVISTTKALYPNKIFVSSPATVDELTFSSCHPSMKRFSDPMVDIGGWESRT
eukprot:TRINITY_DN449_c17_g1_i1.p1 TRINITY_DN449_c17_g1~~TRINITY_DN449_c17_g1_i1.p1  ORF type:complete len:633 (+),score=95.74 TRINITY_DN449_c17_g1_i1:44-1942(+)